MLVKIVLIPLEKLRGNLVLENLIFMKTLKDEMSLIYENKLYQFDSFKVKFKISHQYQHSSGNLLFFAIFVFCRIILKL